MTPDYRDIERIFRVFGESREPDSGFTPVTVEAGRSAVEMLYVFSELEIDPRDINATPEGGITFHWDEGIPWDLGGPGPQVVKDIVVHPHGVVTFRTLGLRAC